MFEPKHSSAAIEASSMRELVQSHASRVGWAKAITSNCIALMFCLVAFGVFRAYDVSQESLPGDAELAANFFAHEAAFDELEQMLSADRRSLGGKGNAEIDLATIAGLDASAVRLGMYRRLLQEISVADLHYFPDSGKLILVPDGEENPERLSVSYVYLPDAQPRSFVRHHGSYLHGPGEDIVTRDRRLKSSWFLRHEVTIQVAVTPY
jgi:hypothetical protein